MKVFYSWQSDLPSGIHRALIRNALTAAVAKVSTELNIEEASRPEVDEATKGEAGMVDIAATILRKIGECSAFVADITPICRPGGGRALPNPNVVFELGYAYAKTGLGAIVGVVNTAEYSLDDLPFDLRGRRVLPYMLKANATSQERTAAQKQLTTDLSKTLSLILSNAIELTATATPIVGVEADPDDESIWKGSRTFEFGLHPSSAEMVTVDRSPKRAFLRVIPAKWEVPAISDVAKASRDLWPPAPGYHLNSGAVDFGFAKACYGDRVDDYSFVAPNVAAFHEETGEWWFLDGASISPHFCEFCIDPARILANWCRCIRQANQTLDQLGAPSTRKITVGIHDVKGAFWFGRPEHKFRKVSVSHSAQNSQWTAVDESIFLGDAYNRVLNAFAAPPLEQEAINQFLAGARGV